MQLDDEILRHIRQRTPSPHHHPNDTPLFHDTSAAIADLSQQTAAVQARAEASESVVEDVCRDIRQYDLAKRHLTEAIEALRGLSHLMDTAEELQAVAETRRYDLATPLYVTTSRLLDKFARFHHVPKVAEMRGRFAAITTMFRNMLLEDFRKLSVGKEVSSPSMLSNLAPAVDLVAAMGDETTREVIQLVCDREVAAYADIYGNAGVTGRLENVENRLAFVRVQVVEKAAQWALFPRAWGVESLLATLLAKITRAHLAELLDAHGKTAKPPIILKALREAVALERDLQRHLRASSVSLDEERDPTSLSRSSDQNHRAAAMVTASRAIRDKYRPEIGSLSGSNSNDAHHARSNLHSMVPTPTAPSFKGFISRAFEGHLDSYVSLTAAVGPAAQGAHCPGDVPAAQVLRGRLTRGGPAVQSHQGFAGARAGSGQLRRCACGFRRMVRNAHHICPRVGGASAPGPAGTSADGRPLPRGRDFFDDSGDDVAFGRRA